MLKPSPPRRSALRQIGPLLLAGLTGCASADTPPPPAGGVTEVQAANFTASEGQARLELRFDRSVAGSELRLSEERPHHCGSGRPVAGDGPWLELGLPHSRAHQLRPRSWQPARGPVERLSIVCDFEGEVRFVADLKGPVSYRSRSHSDPPGLELVIGQ